MSATTEILPHTPWQTVGPFFHYALPWEGGNVLVSPETRGQRITIRGRVFDAEGVVIPDALVEIWQANGEGRYAHPDDTRTDVQLDAGFLGFGRAPTDTDGEYVFQTVLPGRVPGPGNTMQAPHIAVGVLGRGLLKRLVTRIYFPESADNATDPVLGHVEPARIKTLIAVREEGDEPVYRFDIHLQGEQETVFFDV